MVGGSRCFAAAMTEPDPERPPSPTTGAAQESPTEPPFWRDAVIGELPRIPVRLLVAAAELAERSGSRRLSEAHLMCALLRHSRGAVQLLARLQVPVSVVEEHIAAHLEDEVPPDTDIVPRSDGGREIYSYGMVQLIVGRATVLAAARHAHPVDAIDVFVSSLFDPKSLTTYATTLVAGVDRARLLADISGLLGRYDGIAFPSARVTRLELPLRVDWTKRDEVVRLLTSEFGEDVFWSYSKSQDDMLVHAESREVLDLLVSRGLARRSS